MESERDRLLASLPALLKDLAASGVTELDVTAGGASLYLRQRPGAPVAADAPAGGDGLDAAGDEERAAAAEGLVPILAPLAGVFYGAPKPEEPPYVNPGDEVEVGQVVALVEAMKAFNEIHSEVAGTVVAVLVTNGRSVSAGEPLMTVRPDPAALPAEA
jgi:acetyl-CoA carboxylase biotin carboxyl carrier protein